MFIKNLSLYYFLKNKKIYKNPKKTFLLLFLGGFFWVGFLLPTLPAGPPSRCAAPRSCRRRRESSGRAWRARRGSPAVPGSLHRSATVRRLQLVFRIRIRSGLDTDSIRSVDPNLDPRAKMTYKSRKKLGNFMFWSAGCSLLRAEDFSCSLDVLYGDLGISNYWSLRNPDPDAEGPKLPTKVEKIKKCHVLKCWMFSLAGWRLLL